MKALASVRKARINLKNRGTSDLAHADQIEDLFAQAQDLIAEMNSAKLEAMRKAEEPYLKKLEVIDREMAVFVTLMG